MMNQQPDKLFRDKLETYQRPAPAPAWDRIDAELNKKNSAAWPWLKIAATLLLIALAVWILWPKNSTLDGTPQTADKKDAEPKVSPLLPTPRASVQQRAMIPSENQSDAENTEKKNTSSTKKKRVEVPFGKETKVAVEKNPTTIPEEVMTQQDVAIVEDKTEQENIVAKENASERNIKIVFTANDAEKYLVKSSPDEATTDAKKPSRLQKLLDKADDLTTNQDPIGEIRQVKNEILALNFRSEKNREQNK
jgi:hypothetical protein